MRLPARLVSRTRLHSILWGNFSRLPQERMHEMTQLLTGMRTLAQAARLEHTDALHVDPRLVRVAQLFDEAWEIPGTKYRVGFDALIGLIPGLGDLATAMVGRWMLEEAKRLGVPKHRRAQILGYYIIDMVGGAVPLVGDVFDAAYKANIRSLAVIEKHQAAKRKKARR
jgi:Domain of unknown function (DUF4112)